VLNVQSHLPLGLVHAPYAATLTVSGGEGPYTWTIVSGSLPAGLGFDASSGTIAGQPQTTGRFTLRIAVRDSSGLDAQGTAEVTLIVRP
jgi:hypothetical protein